MVFHFDDKKIIHGVNNKIIGYPGTGKTTLLIKLLTEIKLQKPEFKITYLSFTNEAVNTAREKLLAKTDGKNVNFGTIHSMAKQISNTNSKLIHTDIRQCSNSCNCKEVLFEFAKEYCSWYYDEEIKMDLEYSRYTAKLDGLWTLDKSYFEPIFDMVLHYTLSSLIVSNFGSNIYNRNKIMSQINSMLDQIAIPHYSLLTSLDEILDFTLEWLEYKKENHLFEFDDLIFHALDKYLDADVLIVDEYQDTSALQHELISNWSKHIPTVVVAGDYNQSIYGFQGGSPQFLLDFPSENKLVLNHTWRLPKKVLEKTKEILNDEHGFNSVYSDRDDGDIHRVELNELDLNSLIVDNSTIFILARTNKQLDELKSKLQYVFTPQLTLPERSAYARLLNLFKNKQREKILQLLKQHKKRRELFEFALENEYNLEELLEKMNVLKFLTIHASKGLEADLVLLYDHTERKEIESEEEKRVYYVALTRSRGSLLVIYEMTKKRTIYLSAIQ